MLTTITKEEETKTRRNNDNNDDIFHFFLEYHNKLENKGGEELSERSVMKLFR
jgi:hypothetical protein